MQKISDLIIGQGIMQAMMAEEEAIPYSKTLDKIIRQAKSIVISSSNQVC